jgi:hypothetical protein
MLSRQCFQTVSNLDSRSIEKNHNSVKGEKMAGRIKQVIDTIITERANGNEVVAHATKTKLVLKGINPDKYSASSHDDPVVMQRLQKMAHELGIGI